MVVHLFPPVNGTYFSGNDSKYWERAVHVLSSGHLNHGQRWGRSGIRRMTAHSRVGGQAVTF
jgi:hypothetical protein